MDLSCLTFLDPIDVFSMSMSVPLRPRVQLPPRPLSLEAQGELPSGSGRCGPTPYRSEGPRPPLSVQLGAVGSLPPGPDQWGRRGGDKARNLCPRKGRWVVGRDAPKVRPACRWLAG